MIHLWATIRGISLPVTSAITSGRAGPGRRAAWIARQSGRRRGFSPPGIRPPYGGRDTHPGCDAWSSTQQRAQRIRYTHRLFHNLTVDVASNESSFARLLAHALLLNLVWFAAPDFAQLPPTRYVLRQLHTRHAHHTQYIKCCSHRY
jgi:peptidoglycan/xylan/chitin deacetylase (PgdA/CDA1 family)